MDGRLEKMEKDYAEEGVAKLQQAQDLASKGETKKAIETILMPFEKDTRMAGDMATTSKVLVCIVELCFKAQMWQFLNDSMTVLAKKRSLIKASIGKMVKRAYDYVEETPSLEIKIKLIECLRDITDGKIYVELERARLTLKLAHIREGQNKINEAATVLQDLQVETFGSMDRKEKCEFILEQMRFCLANKDIIRAQIISKKIQTRYFKDKADDVEVQKLKLKYYRLMVELKSREENYLEVATFYQNMLQTDIILKNDAERVNGTKAVLLYCLLAEHAPEQVTLLHNTYNLDTIEDDLPDYKKLAENFITQELISWTDLCNKYEKSLKEDSNKTMTDADKVSRESCDSLGKIILFPDEKTWGIFKSRVVEYNLRIISKYYKKISTERLCQLLCLEPDTIEKTIAKLVNKGMIHCKINRLDGIIDFTQVEQPREILNNWSRQLDNLMILVDQTTHLISKEYMLANAKIIGAK